jgi:hypothetical protein
VKSRISGKEAVYVARETPVRSRANRPCLAAFALLGGLARRPEKGGRRGTQGNGGWEADRNGMKGGPGHGEGGAEKFLRSTPNPYGP